ncbi:MAG: AMP-binding protein [Muribaculaceae bacterium]|nr:AMP-binding protein [Muribaculaceae bacterium]
MRHYLKNLEETVRNHWTQKALCDYNGDTFSYANLAINIEQFRVFFDAVGINKGDKIALCARNCARWAMTFWGVNVNGRVAVPLLADFHPDTVALLTTIQTVSCFLLTMTSGRR